MSFFFRRAQPQPAPPPPPPPPAELPVLQQPIHYNYFPPHPNAPVPQPIPFNYFPPHSNTPAPQPLPFNYFLPHPSAPAPAPPAPVLTLDRSARSDFVSGKNDNSDDGEVAQKGSLVAVANSIKRCVSGMGRWDATDLTLGLCKIARRHALEGASDTIDGSVVSNKLELEIILYWLDWAWASYLADEKSVVEFLKMKDYQLKKHMNKSAVSKPAYIIAVDHVKKSVVLSIRGTYAATDVLTDLQPHNESFEGGYAHSGILSAARWILDNEHENLQLYMSENLGYKLVLTGHSLGAGTACLLSFLLYESVGRISSRVGIPISMIECWGYGCPPCVDKHLSEHAAFIKNVVLQDDIVSRVCVAALEDLHSEILHTDWAHVLEDGGRAKKILGLVQSTNSALGEVEQVLGYEPGTFIQQAKRLFYGHVEQVLGGYGHQRGSYIRSGYGGDMQGQCFDVTSGYGGGMYGPPGQCFINGPPPSAYYNAQYNAQGQYFANAPPSPWAAQVAKPTTLAGQLSTVISSFINTPVAVDQPQGKTSSAVTSPAIDGLRLFVPGVLYHIKRSPLVQEENQLVVQEENQIKDQLLKLVTEKFKLNLWKANDNEKGGTHKREPGNSNAGNMQHCIIKGLNPESRFMKIVLSKTLLSDHTLGAYKEGIKDAIRWVTESC